MQNIMIVPNKRKLYVVLILEYFNNSTLKYCCDAALQ